MDIQQKNQIMRSHYLESPHRRSLTQAQGSFMENPSCGDRVRITKENNHWFFDGEGCSLSQVSASILCGILTGLGAQESKEIVLGVLKLFSGEESGIQLSDFGDLAVLDEVLDKPVRKKCVLLAWQAAKRLLEKEKSP